MWKTARHRKKWKLHRDVSPATTEQASNQLSQEAVSNTIPYIHTHTTVTTVLTDKNRIIRSRTYRTNSKTQSNDKDKLQAPPTPTAPFTENHKSEKTEIHEEHNQHYKNSDPKTAARTPQHTKIVN